MDTLIDAGWEFITSAPMQRLYVLTIALCILGTSVWWAFKQLELLRGVEFDDFEKAFPGRPPSRPEAITRRNLAIKAYRDNKWSSLAFSFSSLVVCGYIIPSVLFYLAGSYYTWFGHSVAPFIDLVSREEVAHPTPLGLAIFVVAQVAKGSLMDLFEVFQIDFGIVTNNPTNKSFSTGVFIFRTLMGVYTAVVAVFLWRAVGINWRLGQKAKNSLAGASL